MPVTLLGDEYEVVVEEYDSFGESGFNLRLKKMPEKQAKPRKRK